jgi:hypothetical protein
VRGEIIELVKYKKWEELSWFPDESQYLPTYPLPRHISWIFHIQPQVPDHNFRWVDNIKADSKRIECGLVSLCSGYRPMAGFCEYGNEYSSYIKGEIFINLFIRFSTRILLHAVRQLFLEI